MKFSFVHSLVAGVAMLSAVSAHAATILEISHPESNVILSGGDYVKTSFNVNTSADYLGGQAVITLSSGSIYDYSGGSNTQAPLSSSNPLVTSDSYVCGPSGSSVIISGKASFGTAQAWNSTNIDVSWFNFSGSDIGTFNFAQFTLSDDANGIFTIQVRNKGSLVAGIYVNESATISGAIVNGRFVLDTVPEPASLGMLGLAAAGLLLKRRC